MTITHYSVHLRNLTMLALSSFNHPAEANAVYLRVLSVIPVEQCTGSLREQVVACLNYLVLNGLALKERSGDGYVYSYVSYGYDVEAAV